MVLAGLEVEGGWWVVVVCGFKWWILRILRVGMGMLYSL